MSGRLEGKVVFITGGGSGMGAATSVECAKEGAKAVCIYGRNAEKQNAVAEQVKALGCEAKVYVGMTDDEETVKNAIEDTVKTFGSIDVLINNASLTTTGNLHETKTEDWERIYHSNVFGYYYTMKYALPRMMEQEKKGSIVNVGSIGGMRPLSTTSPYTSSKGAIIQMTRTAAAEYARYGIRINCVNPGTFITPMHRYVMNDKAYLNGKEVPYEEFLASTIPLGRTGEPEEAAKAIVFMASDDASYIVGATLVVDGGAVL